jgi:hypothetical protein
MYTHYPVPSLSRLKELEKILRVEIMLLSRLWTSINDGSPKRCTASIQQTWKVSHLRNAIVILHKSRSESTCSLVEFWPTLGMINDPKLMQREGSEDKHSCAAGVEAGPLSLPLTMHERVMNVDDREVLYCIMRRGMRIACQRRRSIAYIMAFDDQRRS